MKQRLLIELDKAGAEWVVVAYLSGDARMIDVIESGKKPHLVTGCLLTGASEAIVLKEKDLGQMLTDPVQLEELRRTHLPSIYGCFFLPRSMSIYQCGKRSNHALNYIIGPNQLAETMETDSTETKKIIYNYTRIAYPNIPIWWESIKSQLKKDRTLTTCFGDKRRFLDEWGQELFKAATAYIPQSTVSRMVTDGMVLAQSDSNLSDRWDLLANVHDSLLYQVSFSDYKNLAAECIKIGNKYMSPTCSYGGRDFTVKTDLKVGFSWGRMVEVKLTNDVDKLAHDIRIAAGELKRGIQTKVA